MTDFDAQFNQILSDPEAMAQIAKLARSLSGSPSKSSPEVSAGRPAQSVPDPADSSPTQSDSNPADSSATPAQSDLANSSASDRLPDLDAFQKFLPLIQNLGGQRDSDARRLLYALRPYLPPRRQENIERALRLARLWRVGKNFLDLTEREG